MSNPATSTPDPAPEHDLLTRVLERLDKITMLLAGGTQEQRWLTIEQAANYTGLSEKSMRRLLASGRLTPHRPCRGRILIDRRQLDAVISDATTTPRRGRGRA